MNYKQQKSIIWLIPLILLVKLNIALASNWYIFPLASYNQQVNTWLNPKSATYKQNLLSANYQIARLHELSHLYFGTTKTDTSPWSETYVKSLLLATDNKTIAKGEQYYLTIFNNQYNSESQIGYGINYRAYELSWLENIRQNINLSQLQHLTYTRQNRAIATDNMLVRFLPTMDPFFLSSKLPGQGYPFDEMQVSAIYAGTPLYIISTSQDKQWLLVLSPDSIGWVANKDVAWVSDSFIAHWQAAAYAKLGGITQTGVSIINTQGKFCFTGLVGMLFPVLSIQANKITFMLPVKQANGMAVIDSAHLTKEQMGILPLWASPENFAKLFKTLQGRPYGWGNLGFYNDCSAEMKAIYALFGIYLPRNTNNQSLAGKVVNLTNFSPANRLTYLMNHGLPLLTLIRLKGHIVLYVGNYTVNHMTFPLSYQQVWGLTPANRSYRAIIGQAVFLPLLLSYSQDSKLASQLANPVFELIYLNQWPNKPFSQGLAELLY